MSTPSVCNPSLPFVFVDDPDQKYSAIGPHDTILEGDALITPDEVFAVYDGLNRLHPRSRHFTTAVGCKPSGFSADYLVLRAVKPDLREAALALLDYWQGKYEATCTDKEERAVWMNVISALTPTK
jgi:hypothetical protein